MAEARVSESEDTNLLGKADRGMSMILHHGKHATLHWPLQLLFGPLNPQPLMFPALFLFSVALWPHAGHDLLIFEVS